jgi:uncharacterized protein (TIGR04255 family)
VVAKGYRLPAKLREDAILEAILELQFEAATIPEVFAGRVIDNAPWKGFKQNRLPATEMPPTLRRMNPALRYMPDFELSEEAGGSRRVVRFGPSVLSFHRVQGYVGWAAFRPELEEAVDVLFSKAEGLTVTRLGLRYINVFTEARHGIRSLNDLDVGIRVAESPLQGKVNLNYITRLKPKFDCKISIATPGFVQGVRGTELVRVCRRGCLHRRRL